MPQRSGDSNVSTPMWAKARHWSRAVGRHDDLAEWDGYRRLALRVIATAFRDLRGSSPDLRSNARAFLTGQPMLFLWCDVAQIGPAGVMARAEDTAASPETRLRGARRKNGRPQSDTGMARLARARASVS